MYSHGEVLLQKVSAVTTLYQGYSLFRLLQQVIKSSKPTMASHLCSSLDQSWRRLLLTEKSLIAMRSSTPTHLPSQHTRKRPSPIVYFGGLLNNRNDPRSVTPKRAEILLNTTWNAPLRPAGETRSDHFRRRKVRRRAADYSPSPRLQASNLERTQLAGTRCGLRLMVRAKSARVGLSRIPLFHNEGIRKSTESKVKAIISIPTFSVPVD